MRGAMHFIQPIRPHLSANDLFKAQYQKVLRWSFLAALVLTLVAAWLTPQYQPKPYALRENFLQIENIEIIEEIELPEEAPIKPPVIVKEVEPVKDGQEDPFELPPNFGNLPIQEPAGPVWRDPLDNFSPASSNPVLVFFAKPDYPEIARRSQLEGVVIIKVLVGKDGLVKKTMVLQGVNPILNKAAAKAAMKCRFQAGTQRTIPVKAWISIPYSFKLK
jgi:TonB family protein